MMIFILFIHAKSEKSPLKTFIVFLETTRKIVERFKGDKGKVIDDI